MYATVNIHVRPVLLQGKSRHGRNIAIVTSNKSNSTVNAVQVDENLQSELRCRFYFVLDSEGHVRGERSKWCHLIANIDIISYFCDCSQRFRDIKISIFYLENVGQGHVVQCSKWCHSMANI